MLELIDNANANTNTSSTSSYTTANDTNTLLYRRDACMHAYICITTTIMNTM